MDEHPPPAEVRLYQVHPSGRYDRIVPNLDWNVIRSAAATGLLIIVPAAVVSALIFDENSDSSWAILFGFVVLTGFVTAGYLAGAKRSDTPMMHGAAAALACYVVVQLFGLLRRLAAGDDINLISYPVSALFAATFGVAGGVFADWNRRRQLRS